MSKKIIYLSILLLFQFNLFGQVIPGITYYKNKKLTKQVSIKKAKWVKTVTINSDSTTTFELKKIKTNLIVRKEIYLANVPTGIWIEEINNKFVEIDYNFQLEYYDSTSSNEKKKKDTIKYDIKIIANEADKLYPSLVKFLEENFFYHPYAKVKNIHGKVLVSFTISTDGNIENIKIKQKVNPLLDKEAFRLIRLYSMKNNPVINSIPIQEFNVNMPIVFH
jgi:TonB family protein